MKSYRVDYEENRVGKTKSFSHKDSALSLLVDLVDKDIQFEYSIVTRLDVPTSSWDVNDDDYSDD